jgi:hypothetical protein
MTPFPSTVYRRGNRTVNAAIAMIAHPSVGLMLCASQGYPPAFLPAIMWMKLPVLHGAIAESQAH